MLPKSNRDCFEWWPRMMRSDCFELGGEDPSLQAMYQSLLEFKDRILGG